MINFKSNCIMHQKWQFFTVCAAGRLLPVQLGPKAGSCRLRLRGVRQL